MFRDRRTSDVLRMGGSTMVERRRVNGREHLERGLNDAIDTRSKDQEGELVVYSRNNSSTS